MSKKQKWWLFLIPVLLAIMVLTGIFWDEILIRAAPQTVLMSALKETFSALEERFEDEPMLLLAKNVDPEGRYTADLTMDTSYQLLGQTSYDMTVQIDLPSQQVLAEGVIGNAGKDLALSLYLDQNFLAVSSQELLQGNYYGITYDTFAEDIRSIPMLRFLIPEATLQEWTDSIQGVQERMNQEYAIPEFPEISESDLQKAILGVLAFPCKVTQENVPINGAELACHKLTYSASGATVCEILGTIMDTQGASEGTVSASFYLYEKKLVRVGFDGVAGEKQVAYSLLLGTDALADPLTLQIVQTGNGNREETTVNVETQRREQVLYQKWSICQTEKQTNLSYHWNPETGDMELLLDSMQEPITLNLAETEMGFRIVTEDFAELLNALDTEKKDREAISCTMTLQKGTSIEAPAYKNLDQWSLEDLLTLLDGIGSLLGLGLK